MASKREYLDFVLEQLNKVEGISYRSMMGEYLLYYDNKLFGGIYDNRFLVKKTAASVDLLMDAPKEIPFDAKQLAKLVTLIDKGTISSSIGKKVLIELFENPRDPEDIIKEKGWIQISDEGAIKEVVLKIIEANPQSVADFKAGKDRALGFLVGQAMKETKGKANPQMLNKMFLEELNK